MPTRQRTFVNDRVHIEHGDITGYSVDAIVNAGNSQLAGGGGVDGAIHRVGGPVIKEACRDLRRTRYPQGLPTGEVAATPGGDLPARHVIHTVGPIYGSHAGREADLLAACYHNSLQLAAENGWSSVAFPAISTGVYGYPRDEAAAVASTAILDFLNRDTRPITVYLVFFLADDAAVFLAHHKFPD